MRRVFCLGAALVLVCIVPTAAPAVADSSACTHHWSGPQVCVRLEGRNGWNSVTGIWVNPPASVKKRTVWLTQDGRRVLRASTAWREGKTISYTWSSFQQGSDARICVHLEGIRRVACEKTRYIGNRVSW